MSDSTPEFKNRDVYVAAFLRASGQKLIRTDREPGSGRHLFVYADTDELRKLMAGWMSGEAMVNATVYTHAIRDIKALVHS